MRDYLALAMDCQTSWNSENSTEMQRRGEIIRNHIPSWLKEHAASLGIGARYRVHGQDGIGRKALIPWVRVYDPDLSPKPTTGWYVVYLLSADGESCYLALCHATLIWDNGSLRSRSREESASLMAWARNVLVLPSRQDFTTDVDLATQRGRAGAFYWRTTAIALRYARDSLPSSETMVEDLGVFLGLLEQIYLADSRDPSVPGRDPAEVSLVENSLEDHLSHVDRSPKGQGFRLSKTEQRQVERRAVEVATDHLCKLGWTVKDVGARESYDLHCVKGRERLYVEVKGTTSLGESVVLTRNEVALHREKHPNNALIVVSGIILERGDKPKASGGDPKVLSPWLIDDESLRPISYKYEPAELKRAKI